MRHGVQPPRAVDCVRPGPIGLPEKPLRWPPWLTIVTLLPFSKEKLDLNKETDRTTKAVRAIAAQDHKDRESKTTRLRAARLARDAETVSAAQAEQGSRRAPKG